MFYSLMWAAVAVLAGAAAFRFAEVSGFTAERLRRDNNHNLADWEDIALLKFLAFLFATGAFVAAIMAGATS